MEESSEHMLLLCPWVEAVWFGSSLGLKINKNHISTLDSWFIEICKAHNSKTKYGFSPWLAAFVGVSRRVDAALFMTRDQLALPP